MRGSKSQYLIGEERDSAMSVFDQALRERAEPTGVFRALKAACLQRAALKSRDATPAELEWLRGVLQEGEAALVAVRSLIQNTDQNARVVETLRLRNNQRRRTMPS